MYTPRWRTPVVTALLGLLALQLTLSTRRQSLSWDEGDHIHAGYRSLRFRDFGLNPEHPPLVKLLAAVPLLGLDLKLPPLQDREYKIEAFLDGRAFLYENDAEKVIAWARVAPHLLTLLLGLLVFLAAQEMFGPLAGAIALAFVAFEPNVLAHGSYVTTDVALSLFMLAAVYAFYRYVKAPSWPRLLLTGLATGLALASKHAAVLVPMMLVILAASEAWRGREGAPRWPRLLLALAVIGGVSFVVLWATYGFRFAARPAGLALNPPFAQVMGGMPRPYQSAVLGTLHRWHVFPESYLYGMADVFGMEDFYHSYALGTVYPHGVWFYFPLAFVVKSTLAVLLLPAVVAFAALRRRGALFPRAAVFVAVPAAFHFLFALTSRMNIGVRHILPVYPLLAILGGAALASLALRFRPWRLAAGALLGVHALSSLHAFPAYIAYSNELWGGPQNTWRWLTDSNSDWGQQLKSVRRYLDARGVKECWFAYFASGPVDVGYYGIPCRQLPAIDAVWLKQIDMVPEEIDGPVLISAGVLSGFEYGPPPLQPYAVFAGVRPTALIDGGVFVFDGHFRVAAASAFGLAERAGARLEAGDVAGAGEDAARAVALAPDSVKANTVLGDTQAARGEPEAAARSYGAALQAARTIAPDFQGYLGEGLEAKIRALGPASTVRPSEGQR